MRRALGVKSDPIEYRYSFPWLFDLMAAEGVTNLQLGTFFEIYQLPDEWFLRLREESEARGIWIRSVFTSHRELGGFFRFDGDGWDAVARRSFERLIEIGALVGAESVGSNPGAVLRDMPETKAAGIDRYLGNMKELMHLAHMRGLRALTMEPMSCLAEPPTVPKEIRRFAEVLAEYHRSHGDTVPVLYCADVSHGYADAAGVVIHDHWGLLEACLPWTWELHLRNTDVRYAATKGFGDGEAGCIDPSAIRRFYERHGRQLPNEELVGYLEIPGPKLGRDYSDGRLADALIGSLRRLKAQWLGEEEGPQPTVRLAPSIMCADMGDLAAEVGRLEDLGVDMIHVDLMDGRFVPNIPLGLETVRRLRELTRLPLDVHVMAEDNGFFVDRLLPLRVDRISFHLESERHPMRLLRRIREAGVQAGLALCPATDPSAARFAAAEADFLLLMTVDPGFAGQELAPNALEKITATRAAFPDLPIMVDGCVSFENIPEMVRRGSTELVLGSSSLFRREGSLTQNLARVRELVR